MAPYTTKRTYPSWGDPLSVEREVECTCDSCIYLKTTLGQAMLTWSSNFVAECKEAVKRGVDADYTMSLNLNGPTGEELSNMYPTLAGRGRIYSTINFNISDVAQHAPALAEGPDFDVLIEEYQDDPVLLPTLKWMKKRYGA